MSAGTKFSITSEFERFKIHYDSIGPDEVQCLCPFHEDNSPSCKVNTEKLIFHCKSSQCNKAGTAVELLARFINVSIAKVLEHLGKIYPEFQTEKKLIDVQLVEDYHKLIWTNDALRNELYKRGLTDTEIRKYRLGVDQNRITIPIANIAGNFVNVRKYLPGAPGAEKMRNVKGCGQARLYPINQTEYDTLVVCGGECKAIVTAAQLNHLGIGAVCVSSGEGAWDMKFSEHFRNKKVFVLMDIDKAGEVAAKKLAGILNQIASWVGIIRLPLDPKVYPKGDVNDFCSPQNRGQIAPLLDSVEKFIPDAISATFDVTDIPKLVSLGVATHADTTGVRVAFPAVVSAMDTSPYVVPKDVVILCDKDQKYCGSCQVFLQDRNEFQVSPESPTILDFVNTTKLGQLETVKSECKIPLVCKVCKFEATSYYNVEDVRLSPQLEITNRSADRVMQAAFCIGDGLELNEGYDFVGRMFPHPKTQQSTLLISSYTPTQDALSSYKCNDIEYLGHFWPTEWSSEGINTKLTSIYSDFEANVTRIFQRQDLHLAVDLVYHSPLHFKFDGKITKGWVEALVMGDSGHGKSGVACGTDGNGGLMAHYGLGQKVECKNATVAGLLGGLQQMGTRWFVSWGIIPTHDKRLVILEELKGANEEVIARLTDMRSSGIAEIPKIEKRRTHARTRLLAISNPRSEMRIEQYNFGIEAIKELIGGLEDVRRFDFALLISGKDIDTKTLNQLQSSRPQVEHFYTGDMCRKLVLWAWTRTIDQVHFTDEATAKILSEATVLSEMFTDAIPLVDRGSMRLKLARLSASLAARLFSCSEDYEHLIIHECHVDFISAFLKRTYNAPAFGYGDFTNALKIANSLVDPELIRQAIGTTPFPGDLVKQLIAKNKIDLTDLQDWCGWDRDNANVILSLFVRKHALIREGRLYRKSSAFITLLKEMAQSNSYPDRPPFLGERY